MVDSAFVGVLVGGGVTATVQWFVAPRVERRIRVEQRVETALDELWLLLDVDIPEAIEQVRQAASGRKYLETWMKENGVQPDDARFRELRKKDHSDYREGYQRLSTLISHRYRPLSNRARLRYTPGILHLDIAHIRLPHILKWEEFEEETVDQSVRLITADLKAAKALVEEAIERFARTMPTKWQRWKTKARHPVRSIRSARKKKTSS